MISKCTKKVHTHSDNFRFFSCSKVTEYLIKMKKLSVEDKDSLWVGWQLGSFAFSWSTSYVIDFVYNNRDNARFWPFRYMVSSVIDYRWLQNVVRTSMTHLTVIYNWTGARQKWIHVTDYPVDDVYYILFVFQTLGLSNGRDGFDWYRLYLFLNKCL